MSTPTRNGPCPCGSGQRYKLCCGRLSPKEGSALWSLDKALNKALELQKRGEPQEALHLYDQYLLADAGNADAWHMGGVSLFQLGRHREALRYISRAIELVGEPTPDPLLVNLGLCVAALRDPAEPHAPSSGGPLQERFLRQAGLAAPAPRQSSTLVLHAASSAMTSAGTERINFEGESIDELIIVGEAAGSIALPQELSRSLRSVHRIRTVDVPIAEAFNVGVAKAAGDVIFLLEGCGRFAHGRVSLMARALDVTGACWGFSGVDFLDQDGLLACPGTSEEVDSQFLLQERRYAIESWFEGLSTSNFIIALGNLVFRRTLWHNLGGLNASQADPACDIARRAIVHSDPAYVDEPLYLTQLPRQGESSRPSDTPEGGIAWLQASAMRLSKSDPRQPLVERAVQKLRDRIDIDALRQAQGHRFSLARIRSLCRGS